jgi:ABC-2 type transport system permease protein
MKQFLSFVRKEFYHIFRDTRTILILIGIPVVQIILFGFAITTEVKNTRAAVFDPSGDVSTWRIIRQMDASAYFTIERLLNSPEEIDEVFKKGDIDFVVVFGEKFNESLLHTGEAAIQLLADATDPNRATMVTNYASSIIESYRQELMREHPLPFLIRTEIRMLYNPEMKGAYNFVPGVMGMILMLICAMMTSIAIVREKETGTMEVLLASPIKPVYIILAKMTPYFLISWFNLITILLLSVFVLDVPVSGSLFWLNLLSLLFIVVGLSLGLLISTLVRTQVAAVLASGMGLMMPVVILSGMMFPIESMPEILQWFSGIIPARWYIAAVKKLMIEGAPAVHILKEMAILSGMALVIIAVSLKKFSIRLADLSPSPSPQARGAAGVSVIGKDSSFSFLEKILGSSLFLIEKEFRQIFRNPFIPKITVALPLMVMLVFPWATDQEIKNIRIGVVDRDRSVYSGRLTGKIDASSYFILSGLPATNEEALQAVESGNADVILEIEPGFEKKLLTGENATVMLSANAVNSMKSGLGSGYLSGILRDFAEELREEHLPVSGKSSFPAISVVSQNRFNIFMDYKIFMLPALMVMLLTIICGFLPALNIVGEKETGTIEQINVTPVSKFTFIVSKLVPYWTIGLFVLTVCLLLAAPVYGLIPSGSLFTVYFFAIIYIVGISGIGLVISNYSETLQQSMFVIFFFLIVMIMMSGLFTPIASMPQWAQYLTAVNPLKYFIQVMRAVCLKGSDIAHLTTQLVALCAFALFFNGWAVASYRKKD